MTRWPRCSPRRRRSSTARCARISTRSAIGSRAPPGFSSDAAPRRAILTRRAADGSQYVEPRLGIDWFTSDEVGHWRQDPIGQQPIALGAHWGEVRPFVLRRGNQFRVPPPPALASAEYAAAFDEVQRLGGDDITTPSAPPIRR